MQAEPISPAGWKRGAGYSHAIKVGPRLVVAGVLPWNPTTQEVEEQDFASQWSTALENLDEVLRAAGFAASDVISMRIFVADLDAYRAAAGDLGTAWQRVFGRHYPAITLVEVARLIHDDALLEVEAEAIHAESA